MVKSYNQNWTTYAVKCLTVAVVCVFLAWTALAKADIVISSCDGTGGVSHVQSSLTSSESSSSAFNFAITANQSGLGGLSANFSSVPPADPLVMCGIGVSNVSDVAWSNYQVNVTLAVPDQLSSGTYSITNASVYSPAGWTVTSLSPLTYAGTDVSGDYDYTASLNMAGAPSIGIGGELVYGFWLNFGAEPNFSVAVATMSIAAGPEVPEPGTIALVLAGGLSLVAYAWRKQRRTA